MSGNTGTPPVVKVVGFLKLPENSNGIPSADYLDYMHGDGISYQALFSDLNAGNLPPGLVIWTGRKLGVVMGQYGKPQTFAGLKVITS